MARWEHFNPHHCSPNDQLEHVYKESLFVKIIYPVTQFDEARINTRTFSSVQFQDKSGL